MERIITMAFRIFFFIVVFFYQNGGELLIVLTVIYFPAVYAGAFLDNEFKKLKTI